jgi:hypothetical protein
MQKRVQRRGQQASEQAVEMEEASFQPAEQGRCAHRRDPFCLGRQSVGWGPLLPRARLGRAVEN